MRDTTRLHSDLWKRRVRRLRTIARSAVPFVTGMLAVLLAIQIHTMLVPPPRPLTEQDISNTVENVLASATPPPATAADVYQIIRPSLVVVDTNPPNNNKIAQAIGGIDLVLNKRGNANRGLQLAADSDVASGVIINDQGDILTSLHVVANAGTIQLTFADGTQSSARVTAAQPENDIAVLSAGQLPDGVVPATLGNPNAMQIGDDAFVVGNPFRLYNSMSTGVISGFERSFQMPNSNTLLQHMIQVDAAVNPGNSGGPLLNRDGQVIGIMAGFLNPTGQSVFIGIGFAVTITAAAGGAGLPPQ